MIKCLMSNMRGRIYLSKDSLVPARDACTYRKYYPDVALFIYDGSFLVETCIDWFIQNIDKSVSTICFCI